MINFRKIVQQRQRSEKLVCGKGRDCLSVALRDHFKLQKCRGAALGRSGGDGTGEGSRHGSISAEPVVKHQIPLQQDEA